MGAVYKSICYEADTLLLIANQLVEKQIELKLQIEKLMNDGFVNIAKARYIMGSTCVTKMQLPTGNSNPIKPLVTVSRKKENDSWVFSVVRESKSKKTELSGEVSDERLESLGSDSESARTYKSNTSMSRSEAAFKHLLQNDPKSLKKSKNAFLVDDEYYQHYNDELLDEMSNSGSKESLISVTDPIRLFGILVPNVLKEAQVFFVDVVNLLGECGTVQLELSETLDKYTHLRKVKRYIEVAAKQMKLNILTPKVYWTPSETSTVSCYSAVSEAEEEEKSEGSSISVQKSVRSVFYNMTGFDQQERDLSLWGSDITKDEDDNKHDN